MSLYESLNIIVHDFTLDPYDFRAVGKRWGWRLSFIDEEAYKSFHDTAKELHADTFRGCEDWHVLELNEWLYQEYEIGTYNIMEKL